MPQRILQPHNRWPAPGMQCCLYSLILLSCFFKSPEAIAQQAASQVIATAGETLKVSNSMILTWTIGEPLIELHAANSMLLGQGFHQPVFKIAPLTIATAFKNSISVYPNPVMEFITISIAEKKRNNAPAIASVETVKAELRDISGRLVLEQTFTGSEYTLDVHTVANGVYILRLTNQDNSALIGSYTIEKLK